MLLVYLDDHRRDAIARRGQESFGRLVRHAAERRARDERPKPTLKL